MAINYVRTDQLPELIKKLTAGLPHTNTVSEEVNRAGAYKLISLTCVSFQIGAYIQIVSEPESQFSLLISICVWAVDNAYARLIIGWE